MSGLPKPIIELRRLISKMPGFSERGAERFLQWWWQRNAEKEDLLKNWQEFVKYKPCRKCFFFASGDLCDFCSDEERERDKICVTDSAFSAALIDKDSGYNGIYFLLEGDVVGTRSSQVIESVKKRILFLKERVVREKITEVILATDFTSRGEANAIYIEDILRDTHTKVSRLARGLHSGDSLGYSDPVTLKTSFENRA